MSHFVTFDIPLSETQEVGAFVLDGDATGQASISYDPATEMLTITGSFSDLSSALFPVGGADSTGTPESAMHVHVAGVGRNGPIAFNLNVVDNGDGSGTFSREIAITPEQRALFADAGYYINLHTTANPSGELRGQLNVDSAQFDIVDATNVMSEDQEVGTVPADGPATGNVEVLFDGLTKMLRVEGTFSGLSSDLMPVGGTDSAGNPESAIHLHNALAGQNGGIVRNLTVVDNGDGTGSFSGHFTLSDEEIAELRADALYVNLHTTANPSGELRGQLSVGQDVTDIVTNGIPMSEAQEVGTTVADGPATGEFKATLDADTLILTVTGSFSGLSSALLPVGGMDSAGNAESAIHVHEAPSGSNGPIFRNLSVVDNGDGSGTFSGRFQLASEEEAREFAADQYYVNLHTVDNPGGELRGQIDLDSGLFDDVTAGIPMSEAQEVGTTVPDTASTGSYEATFDSDTREFTVNGSYENLTSALLPVGGVDAAGNPESAIHLHFGASSVNGPIVTNLGVNDNGDGTGTFTGSLIVPEDRVSDFDSNFYYVNLHTVDNPSGELRGQLALSSAIQDRTVQRAEITGTPGADMLPTTSDDEIVRAFDGDDTITASAGDDIVDGGGGFDMLMIGAANAAVVASISADSETSINSPLGGTTTVNVEALDLDDGILRLDVNQGQSTGFVQRLYDAGLGRNADAPGGAFWTGIADGGSFDFVDIAAAFLASDEFSNQFGSNLSNSDFVDVLYGNLRGTDGDAAGETFWEGALASGFGRAETLVLFAESDEQVGNFSDDLDQGVFFSDDVLMA